MSSVIRAAAIYFVLLIIFRLAGKRTLSEATTFDFVLLLIVSEAVQQAMIDNDSSMTNAILIVVTLVGLDVAFSLLKRSSKRLDQIVEGASVVLVAGGQPIAERLRKERVAEEDILEAARKLRGLGNMSDIEYAVLEPSGAITIIPRRVV